MNRHNLAGGHIGLLSNESIHELKKFSFGYYDTFAPANVVERDLVNQLIAASWRLARISAMQSAIFEVECGGRKRPTQRRSITWPHTRHVLTFLNMDNEEDAMRKLLRYRFDRQPPSLPEPILESHAPINMCA